MNSISLAARETYFIELEKLKKSSGAVAAVSCSVFPSSVLAGLGLRPVRFPLEVKPVRVNCMPGREDICPLVEQLHQGLSDLTPQVIIGLQTCDMIRRYFQESNRLLKPQVHQLQLPATAGDLSADFYADQVERVCSDIVLGGISSGYSQKRAEAWFTELLTTVNLLHSTAQFIPPVALQYFYHMLRILPPVQVQSIVRFLTAEHETYRSSFSILVAGCPGLPGDDVAAETVEEAGGCLIPVNCSGQAGFPKSKPDVFSPKELSRLQFLAGKCIRKRPNNEVFDYISNAAASYSASGVLLRTLPFCDLWYTEKIRFKENLPVRVQVVSSGFSKGERERTAVRVESFIQTLERGK